MLSSTGRGKSGLRFAPTSVAPGGCRGLPVVTRTLVLVLSIGDVAACAAPAGPVRGRLPAVWAMRVVASCGSQAFWMSAQLARDLRVLRVTDMLAPGRVTVALGTVGATAGAVVSVLALLWGMV